MIIQGIGYWCKVVGNAVGGYPNGKGPAEWSFDLHIDEATKQKLLAEGMDEKYVKTTKDGKAEFIKFVKKEITQKGEKAKPWEIVDRAGRDWDTRKIGNGSVLNVKMAVQERTGPDGKTVMKPAAFKIQVWEHVKFDDEFPIDDSPETQAPEDWSGEE